MDMKALEDRIMEKRVINEEIDVLIAFLNQNRSSTLALSAVLFTENELDIADFQETDNQKSATSTTFVAGNDALLDQAPNLIWHSVHDYFYGDDDDDD